MFGFRKKEEGVVSGLQVFLQELAPLLVKHFRGIPNDAPARIFEKRGKEWATDPLPENPAAAALLTGRGKGIEAGETKIFHNASFSTRPPVRGRVWEPPPYAPDLALDGVVYLVLADRYDLGLLAGSVWVPRDVSKTRIEVAPTSYILGVSKLLREVKKSNSWAPGVQKLNPQLEGFLENFEKGQAPVKPKPKPKKKKGGGGQRRGGGGGQQRRNNNRR